MDGRVIAVPVRSTFANTDEQRKLPLHLVTKCPNTIWYKANVQEWLKTNKIPFQAMLKVELINIAKERKPQKR